MCFSFSYNVATKESYSKTPFEERNKGSSASLGSIVTRCFSAETGHISSPVAARTISTPVWSKSVLLRFRRRIAYLPCSSKVISNRVSFV